MRVRTSGEIKNEDSAESISAQVLEIFTTGISREEHRRRGQRQSGVRPTVLRFETQLLLSSGHANYPHVKWNLPKSFRICEKRQFIFDHDLFMALIRRLANSRHHAGNRVVLAALGE
jgi:hypothetical protein